ncbi:MAG: regulatory protein RecX [Cryobacterium sp.]
MVHFEAADPETGGAAQAGALAPVTYLPGVVPPNEQGQGQGHGRGQSRRGPDSDAGIDGAEAGAADASAGEAGAERERAEKVLLHRLRGRSLSVSEALTILRGTDIDAQEAHEIVERFAELHYIDEEKLADQIVHSHHERKGLGRTGVQAEMRRRGLDANLILEKLEELPDDEAERAIDLAVKRVGQLERFDEKTIDRRLTGFLMRKGYSSGAVRLAVKAALESRSGGTSSSVRFR